MLKTAVELKDAIEKCNTKLKSIGCVPLDKFTWESEYRCKYEDYWGEEKEQHNYDEIEDEDLLHYLKMKKCEDLCNQIKECLKTKFYHTTKVEGEISISYNNVEYKGGLHIPNTKLQEFFDVATDAPFGKWRRRGCRSF